MKIFFVGMHNKPGMKPLDSKTVSGRNIDSVIKLLGSNYDYAKTNLCDCEYMPGPNIVRYWANKWYDQHNPRRGDIIVLLGKFVQQNFLPKKYLRFVNAKHPAVRQLNYVQDTVSRINTAFLLDL